MDKVQQHIQTVRDYDAVYSSQKSTLTVIASNTISPDAHLIANSPTWLQTSIEMLEQQQREIERLQGLVDESRGVTKQIVELYFQGNHFANVHPMFDEAQTLLNLLFPKEDQIPPTGEETANE